MTPPDRSPAQGLARGSCDVPPGVGLRVAHPPERGAGGDAGPGIDCRTARGPLLGRWRALLQDALADNAPLRRTLGRYFDHAMLDAIAAEHAKGRVLLIGTTNLDARRPVIWNIG